MKGNITPQQLQQLRTQVGTWLCNAREAKGLSQQALADRMWVRQETVSKVEAGKWGITVDMLALFCNHLDIDLKKLFK